MSACASYNNRHLSAGGVVEPGRLGFDVEFFVVSMVRVLPLWFSCGFEGPFGGYLSPEP